MQQQEQKSAKTEEVITFNLWRFPSQTTVFLGMSSVTCQAWGRLGADEL